MAHINVDGIITACDKLQNRTTYANGYAHSSALAFDACMRAFDGKPSAKAVTFRVFLNAPIMKEGEATIHADGRLEMRTI